MQRLGPTLDYISLLCSRLTLAALLSTSLACDTQEQEPDPEDSQDDEASSGKHSGSSKGKKPEENQSKSNSELPNSKLEDSDIPSPGKSEDQESDEQDSSTQLPKSEEPDEDDSENGDSDKQEPDEEDSNNEDSKGEDPDKEEPDSSGPIACEGQAPKVVLETNQGTIKIELDGERAPNTVANYIQYLNDKHYDNTIFHRVLSDFMIQGGGYDLSNKLKKERPPIKLEIHPELRHKAGTLAMARTNVKDSATAQFYICVDDSGCKHLDGEYAAFGQTVEGIEVVKQISEVPKSKDGKPHKDVILTKAYCVRDW